jgi:hypothetical protein
MLMVTLERMGVRRAATYATAARLASRLAAQDSAHAFVALAQFQGGLALVHRMRMVGTLDQPRSEALLTSLFAIPLSPSGQYLGALLRWLDQDLRRAIRPAESLDAAIEAAAAGPDGTVTAPRIQWEGKRYRVDPAAGELKRIERIREKQGGATLDLALELAAEARSLADSPAIAPPALQELRARLQARADDLSTEAQREGSQDEGLPPGVPAPPRPLEAVLKAIEDLGRGGNSVPNAARVTRAAGELLDAADEAAAQALISLAYAMYLGDPEGSAMLPGNLSLRHDFGFGQQDTTQRLRAPWMIPRPDVSPGVPWHVDGSLLGLDVALATTALRRLNTDRALSAPTLISNERETFVAGLGLVNPFALTDRARDAIAQGIERGRRRVVAIRDANAVAALADELAMDGWRRRALRWSVVHEPERLESMFSLRELLALGDVPREIDLDPWGTAAIYSDGCVCTEMPAPGGLPLVTGRRQIACACRPAWPNMC